VVEVANETPPVVIEEMAKKLDGHGMVNGLKLMQSGAEMVARSFP
jgi:hypothetical protein